MMPGFCLPLAYFKKGCLRIALSYIGTGLFLLAIWMGVKLRANGPVIRG